MGIFVFGTQPERADIIARVTDATTALRALAEKYAVLERLAGEPDATCAGAYASRRRAEKREVARHFPGALRELDALPACALAERRRAAVEGGLLAEAAGGSWDALPESSRWLRWIWEFHESARASLKEKRARPAAEVARQPPREKLVAELFAAIGKRHGVSADVVRKALFPPRFEVLP